MDANRTVDVFPPNATWTGQGPDDGQADTEYIIQVELRNLLIGVLGVFVNCLAIFVVLKSRKINNSRKLLLLNLIVSDIIFLVACGIFGLVDFVRNSEGTGCILITNLMILAIESSYLFTLLLSVVNYVAVSMPFRYRLLDMKHFWIASVSTWGFSISVCTGSVGVNEFPPGLACSPTLVTPNYALAIMSTVSLIAFFGVMAFNTALMIKLRKGVMISRHGNSLNLRNNNLNRQSFAYRHGMRYQNFLNTFWMYYRRRRNTIIPTVLPLGDNSPRARSPGLTEPNDRPIVCPTQISAVEHRARPCEYVPRAEIQIPISIIQHAGGSSSCSSSLQQNSEPMDELPISTVSPSIAGRTDKICKTLVVLTTYSCLITLPLTVYMMGIASHIIEDPEAMLSTPLHLVLTACPLANSCINPLFYALSFINWRVMYRKLKGR